MNRYGRPTTYKRITPDRGCGFILKRIYELEKAPTDPRKQDVYFGTKWANRPAFASLLWSALVADELIESDGMQEYRPPQWRHRYSIGTMFERAAGHYEAGNGYTVRYHLTPKGRGILFDMMDRVKAKNKTQPKLNTVGSVAEHDAKKDECPVNASEWREDDFLKNMTKTDLIREYSNAAMEADRLDAALLVHENDENGFARDRISAAYNNVCTRRDALAKEIERREKNKDNLNERLKKIAARLEWLDDEISVIRNGLAEIIGQ